MTINAQSKHAISINFNSHAHVERDLKVVVDTLQNKDFNSHAHVERDSVLEKIRVDLPNFNSHAHVERDVRILFRH